jgi:hypothetical protein
MTRACHGPRSWDQVILLVDITLPLVATAVLIVFPYRSENSSLAADCCGTHFRFSLNRSVLLDDSQSPS